MPDNKEVLLKIKCERLTRLIKTTKQTQFETLVQLVKELFGISQCQLQYEDEENELIQLGSDIELKEALKVSDKVSPLKIVVLTSETPTMERPIPSESISFDSSQSASSSQCYTNSPLSNKDAFAMENTPYEKTKRSKSSHKKFGKTPGFYASFCDDIKFESTSNYDNDSWEQKPKKKFKKQKKSGNYYSMLAEDVGKFALFSDQSEPRATSTVVPESSGVDELEKDYEKMSLDEDEAPKWFSKAIDKMSKSISSEVVGALNGAVVASVETVNNQPKSVSQRMRGDHASYIHDGIYCDGCHQVIVGVRFKCGNCPDYDLCEKCELIEDIHESSHVFLKLRYPAVGIGRKHSVMIPLLKDILYKSNNVEQAEEQERRMKEVRKKLKQLAKKKRDEQARLKKCDRKVKKFKGINHVEVQISGDAQFVFLGDGNLPDGSKIVVNTEFVKKWQVMNSGAMAWDDKTKLVHMYGSIPNVSPEVTMPPLRPGEKGEVAVMFLAPEKEGNYFSMWKASHNGQQFGCNLWCKINVTLDDNQSDGEELFVDAVQTPVQSENRLNRPLTPGIKLPPDMSVESVDADEGNGEELPEVDQGQTDIEPRAAQSNTGEVLVTAPEVECSSSVQSCDLEWDTCLVANNESDDLQDIEIISNASSDDYCVVPLPPCFDPDIPLDNIPKRPNVSTGETVANILEADETQRQQNLMQFSSTTESTTLSKPIPILKHVATTTDESPLNTPQEVSSDSVSPPPGETVEEQKQPQERQAKPGSVPASPPGRAVPVIPSQPPAVSVAAASFVDDDVKYEQGKRDYGPDATVRTQPSTTVLPASVSTVTIQPSTVSPPTQSTSQFASTLVNGTLATAKRAIGSVTDTMTTLINGNQASPVVYECGSENVNIVHGNDTTTVRATDVNRGEVQQLIEMGFGDRALNERLLKQYNNDVSKVVTELLNENHNDWSQDRHASR